ncbi:MAG: ATP-binding cassette domain-containing protein, partial [Desulfobacterales bacterium]|nr:ATP-binding cassette domain-containing protein [Desulfobacterales bacterium]
MPKLPKISDNEILLSVQDLKVNFRSEDEVARAVDGVSFDVRREETLCLVGESGCGKTVTALSVMGLVPIPPGEITDGRVLFRGQNLLDFNDSEMQKIRGNQIAMVFQEPLTSLNPVFTIGDQIGEAIYTHEDIP